MNTLTFFFVILGFSFIPIGISGYFVRIVQSISLITITLFIFSIFQQLQIGFIFIQCLSIIFLIYRIWLTYNNSDWIELFKIVFCLLFVFIISFFASLGTDYWAWDEFSHWGAQIDYLIAMKELHLDNTILLFPDYIPGLSLWRYFGYNQLGVDDKSSTYFVNYMLLFSIIFSISGSKFCSKTVIKAFIVYFCMLFFFQSLVITLYVDVIQSLLLLAFLSSLNDKTKINIFYLTTLACMMILSKHVGLIFSIISIFSLFLYQLFVRLRSINEAAKELLLISFCSLSLFFMWSFYVEHYSLARSVINHEKIISLGTINTLESVFLSGIGLLYSYFPHAEFIRSTFSIGENIYLWQLLLLCIFYVCFVGLTSKRNIFERKLFVYLSFSYLFIYLLFLSYVRAGTPWGGDLHSFSRYTSVLLFPIVILPILHIFILNKLIVIFIVTFLLAALVSPPIEKLFSFKKSLYPPSIHLDFDKKASTVKKHLTNSDSIWYIHNEDLIVTYFVFRSKVIPYRVLDFSAGWGLYISRNENIPLAERIITFKKQMCAVDYIYIDNNTEEFWEDFGHLFKNARDIRLFTVSKINDECLINAII